MRAATYDKLPTIPIPDAGADDAVSGWEAVTVTIRAAVGAMEGGVIIVELYPGANRDEIVAGLGAGAAEVIDPAEALKPPAVLEAMLARFLTEDRVFGYLAPFRMVEFFDPERLAVLAERVAAARAAGRPVLVIGTGAALIDDGDVLVYADMPRWEIQQRMRSGLPNWTADNPDEEFLRKYKRGYFVEWRTADRHKMALYDRADFFLDTTEAGMPRLVRGPAMRAALGSLLRRPFRVVPFFDPGVWGGQWMRERFDLPADAPNYAWGFDCVPEENSLRLAFGAVVTEVPAQNLVLRHPEALLGPRVHARFGPEFPIRFDLLDTVGGGNLSLQVHPDVGYIHDTFGMAYTQDESYYILEAGPDAAVYLGFRTGTAVSDFTAAIETAQAGGPHPDIERHVNRFPARKHDHFSIPSGTVHCSGRDCVVLEISATPFIFTFKLWDWGRLGLDGRPRPVHLEHGRRVLRPERDTAWVEENLIGQVAPVAEGDGWREERTGLHPLEFIETRRHWFTAPVEHDTAGSVHVVNLVAGNRAVVESPTEAFAPFMVNYAETFIVPAAVGAYRIRPDGPGEHATLRASVRI
jgi:hypothetical protein